MSNKPIQPTPRPPINHQGRGAGTPTEPTISSSELKRRAAAGKLRGR